MVQLFGNLADGQTVVTQLTDSSIVFHRKHPCPPAAASAPHAGMCYVVSLFEADRVSRPDADYHNRISRDISLTVCLQTPSCHLSCRSLSGTFLGMALWEWLGKPRRNQGAQHLGEWLAQPGCAASMGMARQATSQPGCAASLGATSPPGCAASLGIARQAGSGTLLGMARQATSPPASRRLPGQ
jgi:hypothetical protein